MAKIIFITGTDTGVGKTVMTALLLAYLRKSGCKALAIKPFCSGSRADAILLHQLQEGEISLDEVNPFFTREPVAPGAVSRGRKLISLDSVFAKINALKNRCDVLLVEGSGGLCVPLGKNFTVADLIAKLRCPTLIVSRNQLGTINHTMLTVGALQAAGIKDVRVILVEQKIPDFSSKTNAKMIRKMASPRPVFLLPRLKFRALNPAVIKINATFLKIILARILKDDNLHTFFRKWKTD